MDILIERSMFIWKKFLSQVTEYCARIMGLLVVLFARGGIVGLLGRLRG